MNSPDLTTLAALLERLRAHVGADTPLTIRYHPDADPGDGSGWSVEVGDRRTYGTAGEALTEAIEAADRVTAARKAGGGS